METKVFVKKVINTRKFLVQNQKSGLNHGLCVNTLNRLDRQVKAYGNKWDANGWKNFVKRNAADFLYLIPSNNAKSKLVNELNAIVYG